MKRSRRLRRRYRSRRRSRPAAGLAAVASRCGLPSIDMAGEDGGFSGEAVAADSLRPAHAVTRVRTFVDTFLMPSPCVLHAPRSSWRHRDLLHRATETHHDPAPLSLIAATTAHAAPAAPAAALQPPAAAVGACGGGGSRLPPQPESPSPAGL